MNSESFSKENKSFASVVGEDGLLHRLQQVIIQHGHHHMDISIECDVLDIERELMLTDFPSDSWVDEEFFKDQHYQYPCHILDVFGTADEWEGKCVMQRAVGSRNVLKLTLWAIQHIVDQCEQGELDLLRATCKEFLKITRRCSEQRSRRNIECLFCNEQHLIKFVDLFGLFNFASQLKGWLNFKSLQNWSTEELQQMYNDQLRKIQTDKHYYQQLVTFDSLVPEVQYTWKILGFTAFKLFFYNCIAKQGSNKKLLWQVAASAGEYMEV